MKLEQIPQAVYQAISFQPGTKPSYADLGEQFIKQGLFINNKGHEPLIKSVPDYIEMIDHNIVAGNIVSITEREISQKITVVGKVAQIYSEYELHFEGTLEGVQDRQTRYGVNLFQLICQNGDWKISSMCWDDRDDQTLLEKIA